MFDPFSLPSTNNCAAMHSERRVAVRYPGHPEATCQAYAPAAGVYSAGVRDISATGVALLIGSEFQPGSLLTLELENTEQGVGCFVRARVIHVIEVPPEKRWLHGCAFERPLTRAELHAFAE